MNLKYHEKLTIAIIVFIGVTIITGYIIGFYIGTKDRNNHKNNNSLILENINQF